MRGGDADPIEENKLCEYDRNKELWLIPGVTPSQYNDDSRYEPTNHKPYLL